MARVAALTLVLAAAAVAAAVALAAQSPKALRAAIFAAARKQHSVHYVERGAAQGLRQTMIADVAGASGIQRISFTLQGKKGRLTVVVVKRVAYVRGNALALKDQVGLTSARAARFQGRWISVPPGNAKYKNLAASVTLPSFLHDIYPAAPLAFVTTTIAGHKARGVRGTNREPGVRFATAVFPDAKLRPLGVSDIEASKGFIDAIRISRWNETVHVGAPAASVPISAVQTS